MAAIVTVEEARVACRVTGDENDVLLIPALEAAHEYVRSKVGTFDGIEDDARVKQALLTKTRSLFRPDEDTQGNINRGIVRLLQQVSLDRGH